MNQVATTNNALTFTQEQVDLIKRQIAPKATDSELKLFLYQAQRTGLDPLARQIYCIPIGGKMSIQTSIDGFRVVAERTGNYAGQSEPEFTEDEKGNIICCKVRVYKFSPNGQRYEASVGVAYWSEYAQNSPMWNKMKHTMIAKCAEALALRKAFPQDLSGLYTSDEMAQAGGQEQTVDASFEQIPDDGEKQMLRDLVFSSTLDQAGRETALEQIERCTSYERYSAIQHRLEDLQAGFDDVPNPNATDAKKKVKSILGPKPQEA